MAIKSFQDVQAMTERERSAFDFGIWSALPVATAAEYEAGSLEQVSFIAPIADELPSARRYTKNMENAIGWRGENYKQFVILSKEDEARAARLHREWERR